MSEGRTRGFVGVWPKAGLALAIITVGMGLGVAVAMLLPAVDVGGGDAAAGRSDAAAGCDENAETLDIAADEAVVPIVRELAQAYTTELLDSGRDCIPISVRAVTASAVAGRLANGWRTSTHGPQPDVWIPKSTLWVELLRIQLGDDADLLPEDPTVLARSPTVLAVPRPMAETLGWPDQRLSWQEFFDLADADDGWAEVGEDDWGPFKLGITDPRYTTTGLQALLALDTARGDDALESGTALSLFQVQRALSAIDTSSVETLERYVSSDQPLQAMSATPLEEREVWRFNNTGSPSPIDGGGSEAAGRSEASDDGDRPDLVAMYPSGGDGIAMESDYPYVQLNTSWVSRDVRQVADEFGDYIISDTGVEMFTDAGFRTRENQPGDVLRQDDCLSAMRQVAAEPPGDLPEVGEFRKLRSSWVTVPRVSRTLFLIDVSGSMQAVVPGSDQTRLEATVEAAKQSLDIIPSASDVGLWEFSTGLAGGQGGGDYRELVPTAPLSRVRDGVTQKTALVTALDGIQPANDTALNDSLLAAYEQMRSTYVTGRRHLIVLLTDGRNDDADSISHRRLLRQLRQLHRSQEPVQVISIAYGDQPDVDKLTQISELVGGRVVSSPRLRNLERLFVEALGR